MGDARFDGGDASRIVAMAERIVELKAEVERQQRVGGRWKRKALEQADETIPDLRAEVERLRREAWDREENLRKSAAAQVNALAAEVERLRAAKDRVLEWLRRPQGMGGESIYAAGIAARIEEEFRG